jgi:glycosyltransferase involved in cell wall biosynthesis
VSNPKITVIIPTRERCDVLVKSLQTVTAQDYDNLEILVSDNCSGDQTKDIVHNVHDKRVKYLNTGKRISMSHNWEFALSHVGEGWVTIIGDDDGLLPDSLKKVGEIIQATDIKAIRSSVCSYKWPSLTGQEFGHLTVPQRSGIEVRDSKAWLSRVMNGRAPYPELPMLYNGGFVNMSVLQEIKRKTGAFYKSLTPDVYSALAIASVVKNYIYSNEPLAINGASKHSTGTSAFSGDTKSILSPLQLFSSEENIPFHKDIPLCADGKFPLSIHISVYEAYLQLGAIWGEFQKISHSQQLEIILATTTPGHEGEIKEWGKLFAISHGLNFFEIQSKATRRRYYLKLLTFPRELLNGVNTDHIGGFLDLPIRDVYEASVAAFTIRNAKPCRIRNFLRLLRKHILLPLFTINIS